MNVKEIVKKYLDENGFDGLYNDRCGCEKDDLMLCNENLEKCKPGYKRKFSEKCHESCKYGHGTYCEGQSNAYCMGSMKENG